jgi:hypothetical protein
MEIFQTPESIEIGKKLSIILKEANIQPKVTDTIACKEAVKRCSTAIEFMENLISTRSSSDEYSNNNLKPEIEKLKKMIDHYETLIEESMFE